MNDEGRIMRGCPGIQKTKRICDGGEYKGLTFSPDSLMNHEGRRMTGSGSIGILEKKRNK